MTQAKCSVNTRFPPSLLIIGSELRKSSRNCLKNWREVTWRKDRRPRITLNVRGSLTNYRKIWLNTLVTSLQGPGLLRLRWNKFSSVHDDLKLAKKEWVTNTQTHSRFTPTLNISKNGYNIPSSIARVHIISDWSFRAFWRKIASRNRKTCLICGLFIRNTGCLLVKFWQISRELASRSTANTCRR